MKAFGRQIGRGLGSVLGALWNYRRETGRSLAFWALLALLQAAAQIVFRENLLPGNFATLNTLLAAVALILVPAAALEHAFTHFHPHQPTPERLSTFREARLPLAQGFLAVWAVLSLAVLALVLEAVNVPRISLVLLALVSGLVALGGCFSAVYYRHRNRLWFWAALVLAAAIARLAFAFGLTVAEPYAEAVLAAGILAGFILLLPLLRQTRIPFAWRKARAAWRDREFLVHLAATFSTLLGLFLFTNADRIVAQAWFGRPQGNNIGFVPWAQFDAYQTAGLLGRALVWGAQPILLVLLVRRAPQERTSPGVRQIFWLYSGVIVAGAILLHALADPLGHLFGWGEPEQTAAYLSGFALAMLPVGLLQGLGIFALASRRYPECFTLGGCGVVYALVLYFVGRPQLLVSYVFGGSAVALFVVLFVGVVRWGRKQP
jgi:hypothetical protein